MSEPISTTVRPDVEYVAGHALHWSRSTLRRLPWAFDDLSRDFGDDIYERMLLDPQVIAVVNVLRASIIADGARLASPVGDQDADGFAHGMAICDFCCAVLEDLETPLDDVLWDLLKAIALGSRVAEEVYDETQLQQKGRLVLKALKPKPRHSVAFVTDAFLNIQGILGTIPGQGRGLGMGTFAIGQSPPPNLLPRSKFAVLSFRPENHDPRGTTVLRPAYGPWWSKQQAWQEYLKYLSQFASPSLIGTTAENAEKGGGTKITMPDGTKKTPSEVLLDTLLAFQNGTALAVPYGTVVKALEVNGNGLPFLNAIKLCDQQITIAVLHQTRATMEAENGSRADSETAQDILGTIVRQARRSVALMLRRDVLRPMVAVNYGDTAAAKLTPTVSLGVVEQQDMAALYTAVANLARAGYLHPSQYSELDERLNLPPRDMAQVQAEREQAMQVQQQPPPSPQNDPANDEEDDDANL